MQYTYYQKSGEMDFDGMPFAKGLYAGIYGGKNNPAMQDVKLTGPLPCGLYTICEPYESSEMGPLTMNLLPDPKNEMFGRGEFRIHGERIKDPPGFASRGCIVMNRGYRLAIANGLRDGDCTLEVKAER